MIVLSFCLLLGIFIGFSSALLGLGGNIFIVPLLPIVADIPMQEVVATGIFSVFFITLTNTLFYLREKLIDFKLIALLIFPTFLFSYVGSMLAQHVSGSFISFMLIFIMILMLVRMNIKVKSSDSSKRLGKSVIALAGSVSGIFAGMTGIGSGVILGPMMLGFNLVEHKKVSPTINFMIAVACLSATMSNMSQGSLQGSQFGLVHLDIAGALLAPALISSFYGRRMNRGISKEKREKIVSILLVLLIVKLLFAVF